MNSNDINVLRISTQTYVLTYYDQNLILLNMATFHLGFNIRILNLNFVLILIVESQVEG